MVWTPVYAIFYLSRLPTGPHHCPIEQATQCRRNGQISIKNSQLTVADWKISKICGALSHKYNLNQSSQSRFNDVNWIQ